MKSIDKTHQERRAHARASVPSRWRIGAATVSTEELQAWQLGPARLDGLLRAPQRRGRE